jgi:hypothetical protein
MAVIHGNPGPGLSPAVSWLTLDVGCTYVWHLIGVSPSTVPFQTPAGPGAPCMYKVCPEQKLDASEAKNSTP